MHCQGINPMAGFVKVFLRGLLIIQKKPGANGLIQNTMWLFFFFSNLYSASMLQPSGQAAFPGEAVCSHAWSWLSLWLCHKEGGEFSMQEFASKSDGAFVLLFYYLTVLYSPHYMKHFFLQYVLLHACGSKIYLLPDQILLSSSFNAYGSWNIRHQIRAVSNSAEWMVLLLQGLTYHCHNRSKTI